MCVWTFHFSSSSISKAWKSSPDWQTYFSSGWVGYGYLGQENQSASQPVSPLPQLVFHKKEMEIKKRERKGKTVLKWEPHRWLTFVMVTDNRNRTTKVPFLFLPFGTEVIPVCSRGYGEPDLRIKHPNQICPTLTLTWEGRKCRWRADTSDSLVHRERAQKSHAVEFLV